jgi:hypothetical protein
MSDTKTLPADLVLFWREEADYNRKLARSSTVADTLLDQARILERNANALAAAIQAQKSADPSCWHCGDVLIGPLPKPRCESCPDECDVEGCEAPGCEELRNA